MGAEGEPVRDTVQLVRRRWGVVLASYLPLAAMLTAITVALLTGGGHAGKDTPSVFIVTLFAALVPWLTRLFDKTERRETLDVVASSAGLSAGGAVLRAREQLAEGYLTETGGRCRVRLVGKKGASTMVLELASRVRALELLRALELDVLHRAFECRGVLNYEYLNIPARIVVGADGVLVTYAGYFRYGELTSVKRDGNVVVLERAHGDALRFLAGSSTAALHERLAEALEAFRRGEQPADAASLVAQRGRPVGEWRRALAALLTEKDYRTAAVTPEQLWRVAEDPTAEASARAGAAAALRPTLDEAGKARLRAAASAAVAPGVRVVLEAAAGEQEEALEEAFAELEREHAAKARG